MCTATFPCSESFQYRRRSGWESSTQLLDIFRYFIFYFNLLVSSNLYEHHLSQISLARWTLLSLTSLFKNRKTCFSIPHGFLSTFPLLLFTCSIVWWFASESVHLCYGVSSTLWVLFLQSPERLEHRTRPCTLQEWVIFWNATSNYNNSQVPLPSSFWKKLVCYGLSYWKRWGDTGSQHGKWQLPTVEESCLRIHSGESKDMRSSVHSKFDNHLGTSATVCWHFIHLNSSSHRQQEDTDATRIGRGEI